MAFFDRIPWATMVPRTAVPEWTTEGVAPSPLEERVADLERRLAAIEPFGRGEKARHSRKGSGNR